MKELAAELRREVETARLACRNLSDYALMCWLSAGGTATALTRLRQAPDDQLTAAGQHRHPEGEDGRCRAR